MSPDNVVRKYEIRKHEERVKTIIERANLRDFTLCCAIIDTLARWPALKFEDLHRLVCDKLTVSVKEKHFQRAIDYTNERLRLINNLDPKTVVCVASIYSITVEVDGAFFTRLVLVHNSI